MEEIKYMFGILLGEIYELRNQISRLRQEDLPYEQFTIDSLKNGIFEHIVDRELRLDNDFALTRERYEEISMALDDFEIKNKDVVDNLDGFNGLPMEIRDRFSQEEWLLALRAMKNERIFNNIISRIENGTNTPERYKNLN